MTTGLQLKRIYEAPAAGDGFRVLVDRLWPRGISKEKARIDLWLREIAPSTELRQWFDHDADKWPEFKRRYRAELKEDPLKKEKLSELRRLKKEKPELTLLFSSKEEKFNNAHALKSFL